MAAMKPRTGEGPLEVTKEGRGLVMRVPLEGGGRLVVELSPDEAEALLNDEFDLGLERTHVEELITRTEGWPAGLYLAALSLRGAADRDAFIGRFGGSTRPVVDFLVDEVLGTYDPKLQATMLRCSVLERLCGSLCDAVLEQEGTGELLRSLSDEHVLRSLMAERRATRAEIAAATGLSKPTVSESVRRLEEAGVVVDTGERTVGRGRVGTYYALAPATGHALTMFKIPRAILAAVPEGPLTRDAVKVRALFEDASRTTVVPTATTRRPAACVSLTARAVWRGTR